MKKLIYGLTLVLISTVSCNKDDVLTLDETKFIGEYRGDAIHSYRGVGTIWYDQPILETTSIISKENGRYYIEIDGRIIDVICLKKTKFRLVQKGNVFKVENEPMEVTVDPQKEQIDIYGENGDRCSFKDSDKIKVTQKLF